MAPTLSTPSLLACEPRFATPRTDRATLGPKVADIAEALGTPFMPWQRQVTDVALEVDDDGRPVYRKIVLTVPRQSGKTTLLLAMFVHRALSWGSPQVMTYAAQTGVDARKKFVDDQIPILRRSPFRPLFRPRLTSGHEAILWKNGSRHGIMASTEKTGHGPTLDLGVVDEAFAQPDARLEQAMSPSMVTRRDAQLWTVSTAGDDKSTYFRGKVDTGRASFSNTNGGTAFFEWSADDDADPEDPAVWWACMPALGHTVTEDIIRSELGSMDRNEFRRAYLNQWVSGGPVDPDRIPPAAWAACADPTSTPVGRVVFAVDMSPDGAVCSIAVAGHRADGIPHVEVVDSRAGTDWVPARLAELTVKYETASPVVWQPNAPIGMLGPRLDAAGVQLRAMTGVEFAQACGALKDDVIRGEVRHMGGPILEAAFASAERRVGVEGAWTWGRRRSAGDISPLVAVTEALWGLTAAGSGEPSVYVF
jgi:Phage Terminase